MRTLASENPALAAQWDYDKNGDTKPEDVPPFTARKFWWKCKRGHSWCAAARNRSNGNGCPYCSNQAVLPGYNSLAALNPKLAAEWDYDKNTGITPEMITPASGKKYWWRCSNGHSWSSSVANRNKGNACPYCSGRKVLLGFNDIPTSHPHVAEQWDYDKNGGRIPEHFYIGSTARAWWRCELGHSWNAQIRTRRKTGCPVCAGHVVVVGFNDLATKNPALAEEWDYEKNENLTPFDLTASTPRKAWWLAACGHSWQATVASRNSGNGCPYCANNATLKGYNDLQSIAPRLVSEWDWSRNGELRPDALSLFSRTKVWWRCKRGHSWRISPFSRSQGSGCPYCAGKRNRVPKLID